MHGCPCTRLASWSRLASCDKCALVFPLHTLLLRQDGQLVRVPCSKLGASLDVPAWKPKKPDWQRQGVLQAGFEPAKRNARDLKSPPVDQARELQS